MAALLRVLSLFVTICVLHQSLSVAAQDACTVLSVSSECSLEDDGCSALQEELEQLVAWKESSRASGCVELQLTAGVHVLSRAVAIAGVNVSVSIRGEGNDSAIACAPSVTLDMNHAISFDGLDSVAFEGVAVYNCARPIRISNSRMVAFTQSMFRFFMSGAVDVFNCVEVNFSSVTFMDNQAVSPITDTPFRSNAGGLSIGVHGIPFTNSSPAINILNCTFLRNEARPPSQDVVTTSNLFLRNIFLGRGGGLGVFVRESIRVVTNIQDCVFEENFATTFGGGTYVIMDGSVANHSVYVSGSLYVNNACDGGGGGLHTGYFTPTTALHSVVATNCTFIGNRALLGGGSYVFPGIGVGRVYSVTYRSCVFQRNVATEYGSALGLFSLDVFESHEDINAYIIEDCIFEGNFGSRAGTLSAAYSPVLMLGHNDFIGNIGPTLRLLGTTLTVNSTLEFIGNVADNSDGGALYVTSYGQVVLEDGAEMKFIGNRGQLGSAIVVEAQRLSAGAFVTLAYNPQCFLRYGPDQSLSPELWDNVSLTFSGNSAVVGPAVYINQLNLCSWYQLSPPYFDRAMVLRWPFVNLTDDNRNTGHRQENVNDSSLYIQTPAVSLAVVTPSIDGYPGQPLKLQVRALDELENPTTSIVRLNNPMPLNTLSSSGSEETYSFEPTLLAFQPQSDGEAMSFVVDTDYSSVSEYEVTLSIYDSTTGTPEAESIIQDVSFYARQCPPGYNLKAERSEVFRTCQCNTANNPFLLECDNNQLIISPQVWTTVDTSSDGTQILRGFHCPLDYCQPIHNTSFGSMTYASVFNAGNSDLQCNCNRSGVLCGQCPDGYGVSALFNHCVTCSNAYAMLVVILVLVDVLVVIAIVARSQPLSAWIYPCLFHIQILPLITSEFPISFEKVQSVLYYISNALGFYFPYDFCLYSSMSSLVAYTFRYLPLTTALIAIPVVISIRHVKFRPVPWHGAWMVVLLLYPNVVHTSISILTCPVVSPYGSRWYIDGTIQCFTGGHAALGVLAILVLLSAALLVPLTIALSVNLIKNPRWQRRIVLPMVYAYRENFHWCVGIELARRFVVLLFALAFPGELVVTGFVLMVSATSYLYIQPYKSKVANMVEALLSIDSVLLFLIASNSAVTEGLTVDESTQLETVTFHQDDCPNPVSGVTRLSKLLIPFYYLPLLVLLLGTVVSIVLCVRRRWTNRMDEETTIPDTAYELGDYTLQKTAAFTHTSISTNSYSDKL